jgi:ABC-type bacteriocin/lantibiotic exporter with double-glycine peptidase domain
MVLEYLGVAVGDEELSRWLGTTDRGTPFPNIKRLEALGLFVEVGQYGDLSLFERTIELGLPVIVAVKTLNWPHWGNVITDHAVVVVGIDQQHGVIYIHDPSFAAAPIELSLIEFETGWIERDQQYAVIRLAPP